MYDVFAEELKKLISAEREEQKEQLARGYGRDDYDRRVGVIRGFDEVGEMIDKLVRRFRDGI